MDPTDTVSFLAEELAVNHPELSVTFEVADLSISDVKGAIQYLNLDPAIEEAVQRRMEQWRQMVEEGVQERQRIRAAAAAALENGIEDDAGVVGD
jgi:DNA-binding transcriptional MerR regulator